MSRSPALLLTNQKFLNASLCKCKLSTKGSFALSADFGFLLRSFSTFNVNQGQRTLHSFKMLGTFQAFVECWFDQPAISLSKGKHTPLLWSRNHYSNERILITTRIHSTLWQPHRLRPLRTTTLSCVHIRTQYKIDKLTLTSGQSFNQMRSQRY